MFSARTHRGNRQAAQIGTRTLNANPPLPRSGSSADRGAAVLRAAAAGRPARHWKCRAHQRKSAEADWARGQSSRLEPASVGKPGTSSAASARALAPCPPLNRGRERGLGVRAALYAWTLYQAQEGVAPSLNVGWTAPPEESSRWVGCTLKPLYGP